MWWEEEETQWWLRGKHCDCNNMISKMVVKDNHHKKIITLLAIMPIQIVIKFDIHLFGRGIHFNDTIMKAIERTLIKNEIAKK